MRCDGECALQSQLSTVGPSRNFVRLKGYLYIFLNILSINLNRNQKIRNEQFYLLQKFRLRTPFFKHTLLRNASRSKMLSWAELNCLFIYKKEYNEIPIWVSGDTPLSRTKRRKRKPLFQELPREVVVLNFSKEEKVSEDGTALQVTGKEIWEKLIYELF